MRMLWHLNENAKNPEAIRMEKLNLVQDGTYPQWQGSGLPCYGDLRTVIMHEVIGRNSFVLDKKEAAFPAFKDGEEQNVLYFNDLFPFNIIYLDDPKSDKGNDDNEIDMIQSSGEAKVVGYTEEIVHDFEQRLETIFDRQVNRVHILDFNGFTPDMRQDLAERMRMVYTEDDGQELGGARRSMTWRQFILALGLYTAEEVAEDGFGAYWLGSERVIPDKGDPNDYWVEISSGRDFLRGALVAVKFIYV
ncbi:hypothetical protein Tco_0446642 [Tanacetum coccineum]